MNASFEFTLHSPLTKEDWNRISDAEYENTMFVTFHTPQGRRVRYIKYEVLDKIRADINTMPCAITSMREIYVNRDKVINILDKYKAESEG